MEILERQFLSWVQFTFTIMFHILFPTLTIGLGLYLIVTASQPETLRFTLWGAVTILPVVIGYVIYSYWVFRGKAGQERHYG